jgi:hypothetical protein
MELDLPCRLGKKNWLIVFTFALIILLSYYIWPLLDGLVLGLVFAYVGRPVRDLFGKNRLAGRHHLHCRSPLRHLCHGSPGGIKPDKVAGEPSEGDRIPHL